MMLDNNVIEAATQWLITGAAIVGGAPNDIHIAGGLIVAVGRGLVVPGARVLNAHGLIALPGLVDLHTHLREPGDEISETIETGTQAAALGGYTTVHAMPNTTPTADTALAVERVWRRGQELGYCDVRPVGAVTVGRAGGQLVDMRAMTHSAAAVRVFSDDGACVADPLVMWRALRLAQVLDCVVAQHAEDLRLPNTDGAAEEIIIARDCLLAARTGAALHVCHVSTAPAVEIIRWAKSQGWRVTAEVTPHHLLLTRVAVFGAPPLRGMLSRGVLSVGAPPALATVGAPSAAFKVNPPLRKWKDVMALRAGLADGTIDCVATDHAPHSAVSKCGGWEAARPGMPGLETALRVVQLTMVNTGLLDWAGVADRMSVRPARIGRVHEHGGAIAAGWPANIVLYDPLAAPEAVRARASKSATSPYTRMLLPGRVCATFLRGVPTVLDGQLVLRPHKRSGHWLDSRVACL